MRKAALFALMLTLPLAACGGEERDQAAMLQQQYAAVEEAAMEAELVCHYDGEVRSYTLLCAYTPSSSEVTVLAPEELAGISAVVENGALTLRCDDISLDAGTYTDAAASPVAVLPKLMEAAGGGYVTEESIETLADRAALRMTCDLQDDTLTRYTTWFDQESLLPLRSEVAVDGEVLCEVTWTRFEVSRQRPPEETS